MNNSVTSSKSNKIAMGALEGSYAVVLANYAIVLGKIVKDLLIHRMFYLDINIIIFAFIIISIVNVIIEWVALKQTGNESTIKLFVENILTLVCFFIIGQIFSEIYPLTENIKIADIAKIIAISNIVVFTLYFLWNIQYIKELRRAKEKSTKAFVAVICNICSFVINLSLLFISVFATQTAIYVVLSVFVIDSFINFVISFLALFPQKRGVLPPYYVIETTSRCNYSCSICPHSIKHSFPEKDMDISLYLKIVKQIRNSAKAILLYWMGEPLLNPNLFEMIRIAKQQTKAKVVISTNGSLLSDENVRKLLESGIDKIIISCDAAESQDIYSEIRRGGDIGVLNNNISKLLLNNQQKVEVELQFIEMFVNKKEIEKFKEKWSSCKLSFSCLYDRAGQMPQLNQRSDKLSPVKELERTPCCDLWNKMCIHADGTVALCCFDYDSVVKIGDAQSETLKDIWSGSKINEYRDNHNRGQYFSICKDCNAWAVEQEYKEFE